MDPDPYFKVRFFGVEKMLHCVADLLAEERINGRPGAKRWRR